MEMTCKDDMVFFTPECEHDIFRLGKLAERVDSVSIRYLRKDKIYTVGYVGVDKDILLNKLVGEI